MLKIASIVFAGVALAAGAASAQIALPTTPPPSSNDNVQQGAVVTVGSTQSGNLAVGVVGGQTLPVNTTVSPDGTAPSSGVNAYARVNKNGLGVPEGADVRVSATDKQGQQQPYQGVQVGKQ